MGEGNHTPFVAPENGTPENKTTHTTTKSNQWKYLIAGTAGALLIAASAFQVYRGRDVSAETTGKARVGTQSSASQKNLARVGNSLISYDIVAKECVARYGPEVLEKIINRTMIQKACEEKGIVITKDEVNAEVSKIAKRFKLDPTSWYQMLMAERNLSKLQYQRDIIWPMLALKKLAGTDVKVTREDLKKTFERDYGSRAEVRIIMMDNQRQMQNVWEEAVDSQRSGPKEALKKFQQLAQTHSIEPTSRALGGSVPPIRRNSGSNNIEKAAFDLKVGEISPIIQVGSRTTSRYVILYCEGFTKPEVTDVREVQETLMTQIKEEKVQKAVAETFSKLKKETEVHNFLTGNVNQPTERIKQTSFNTGARTSSVKNKSEYSRPRRTTSRN